MRALIASTLAAVLAWSASARAIDFDTTITDRAAIIDGQSLKLRGHHIRLWGIVTPTGSEPGANEATVKMFKTYDGFYVTCHLPRLDRVNVTPGICEYAGRDLGAVMVLAGLGRDCPSESRGHYRLQEAKAKAAGARITESFALPSFCGPPVKQ